MGADATHRIPGLSDAVEILVDRWGIPHIYAKNEADLFLAQGFNAARDRLWQIDTWRKRGLGLLAADLGPAFLARDKAARLFLYRGDMDAEWAAYGPRAKAWTESFVAGINAYVDLVRREPARLPAEFRLLGTEPAMWAAEDVVRCRAHALVKNVETEIARANIAARFGIEADRLHRKLEPAWTTRLPDGLPPGPIPPEVWRTYLLATDPLALAAGDPMSPPRLDALANTGSNNWAIAPARTATGRPILASDPHRVHELPSLRYIAHLSAPGLDVIGAGEPAVPGVSFGHNDRVAFCLTIHPADQEDLYVYELDPADALRYRYGQDWERMRVVRERVEVRGAAAEDVALFFTRHGPVLHIDRAANRAYAVRTIWNEPGAAAYLGSLRYMGARNAAEYRDALAHWVSPSSNHVFADVDGHIGWAVGAHIPKRPNWDGLAPVPGDGRYEWAGFNTAREMPQMFDPPRGWVGTANEMNLPPEFDSARHKTGFEFSDGARAARLHEAMAADKRWTLADNQALQADVTSMTARRMCAVLAQASGFAGEAARARALFAGWDHVLGAGSAPAALFEIWFSKHLTPAVIATLGPPGLAAMVAVPDTALIADVIEACDPGFGEPAARDALLARTLAAAWAEVVSLLGPDPTSWAWGRLHQGYFEHPLTRLAPAALKARLDVGPLPKGGSKLTLNNNGYRNTDFRVISGVSWRMVADVGAWDNSVTVNAPGQSGDPASPHYRDHFPLWAEERYVPMLYSRAAVEAATERRIVLVPAT